MIRAAARALWPIWREFHILRLRRLMRELPAHDMRQAELILEVHALENTTC